MLALVVAVAVSGVLFLSGTLVYQVASKNQGDASFRRIEAQALDAAEGGLNRAYQAVEMANNASNLPCGTGVLSEQLSTSPAKSSYSATVNYYDTFPPTDAPLSCAAVLNGTTTAVAAEILSTGTTATGTAQQTNKYMEALLKISVATIYSNVFDNALFSDLTMIGSNNTTVDGHNGNDGNLYTNGSLSCGNGFLIQGNVTVQGSVTATNNCTINGNLTSVGNMSLANSAVIGGSATSTGKTCSSQGNITLANSATIDQSAYAYCAVTTSGNSTVVHGTYAPDTTLTNPAVETLPNVPMPVSGSSAAALWSAAGFTNQITDNNCAANGVYQDIANMSTATTPTLIMTSCALSWSGNSSVSLNTNLAVYSTGGFTMSNNTSWQSTNSTTRLLYLIVPSSAGPAPCSSGITFANNTQFATTVNVLDFTPCTITISNNSTGYGQVYGGQIDATNLFTAHYMPMPTVPGASGGGSVNAMSTIAVVYERQISSLSAA
jgi:predicted acyltransferase (DUF342 family)